MLTPGFELGFGRSAAAWDQLQFSKDQDNNPRVEVVEVSDRTELWVAVCKMDVRRRKIMRRGDNL